jgi:hypothetical protein
VKHHGTGNSYDRLDGTFSVSIFMMGTSPSEVNDLLKLGKSFREIAEFESSTFVGYKRLSKFWCIDSFLFGFANFPTFSPLRRRKLTARNAFLKMKSHAGYGSQGKMQWNYNSRTAERKKSKRRDRL